MNRHRHKSRLFKPRHSQAKHSQVEKKTGLAVLFTMIGKIVKGAVLVLGSIMLFFIVLGALIGAGTSSKKGGGLPDEMIVHLNLDYNVGEEPVKPSFTNPVAIIAMTRISNNANPVIHCHQKGLLGARGILGERSHTAIRMLPDFGMIHCALAPVDFPPFRFLADLLTSPSCHY